MFHSLLRVGVCRLHTSTYLRAVDKASLSKLRKRTGISFINCKKALEKFNNDIKKAEVWLKEQALKEGWTKASKLENRAMSQGLIGLMVDQNSGVMVEVNCETDFVARNEKFQKFVASVTLACLHHGQQAGQQKMLLDTNSLKALSVNGDKTLHDMVAMEIGNIGENMRVRRAVYLQVVDSCKLGSYVHNAGDQVKKGKCRIGKYGSLVVFRQKEQSRGHQLSSAHLGAQLGQHIVGMNPTSLGTMEDETETEIEGDSPGEKPEVGDSPDKKPDDDSRLLQQEFLLDPDLTVKDFVVMNSASVEDFVRFECGEKIANEEN